MGNLRTALLAWLSARLQGGKFYLRIEDIDTPRVVKGSADQILRDLEWLGLDWDGEVVCQSQRLELYEDALSDLKKRDLIYSCYCSRKTIQQAIEQIVQEKGLAHDAGRVYPQTCRNLSQAQRQSESMSKPESLRLKTQKGTLEFNDLICSKQLIDMPSECGDFILKRADGLHAYQLAVTVDDIEQSITEVIRGADLLQETFKQIHLAQTLNASPISYGHVPLMLDSQGKKMSKRDGSQSLAQIDAASKYPGKVVADFANSLGLDVGERISPSQLLSYTDFDEFLTNLSRI